MGLMGHFEAGEVAKVLARISRCNRRQLRLMEGELLYTKCHTFINPCDEFGPITPASEGVLQQLASFSHPHL